ncbi:radial spoke head 10 homolog B isoform X1 [Ictalurus furcatus]|uniref:radial spoke head 10 homolog B isoform X1 n=2 Tax=Ictalurus furcatus TaxID=66913 RepID=UPI002350F261|nr:radial spoke head 10 homolog B isoform X1 [Ictalurus furcatus]
MAEEEDRTEKSDRMTREEFPLHEMENSSASSGVSEARAALETRETGEPEIPAVHVLSDIIIQRYEGGRCGELFHGEGVAYFRGGHVYKGSFVDGFMHGHGVYTWADGLKYEGDFESNAPMGHGIYTWLDCSTYEGEVCNGICHGTGTYISPKTSTIYRGQWHKGKRHGKGTMYYNQEATSWYKGDWENNQREGWGMRCYPSGDTYEGQWKNSIRHGEGTMKWIQLGQQYSGQWLNGFQHGHGTHTWFLRRVFGSQYPLRNQYTGEFAQGVRHGQGTFVYASGSVYSGCWKNNKKHGQGKFVYKNGRTYEEEFIDDRMAEFPSSSIISRALGGLPSKPEESDGYASLLGPDMALNIETLLNRIPEAQRRQELKQVEFAIMRHIELLRSIYSLYSSLGHENSPDNTFLLSHLQFCRFLKDCSVHQHGLTLAQLDHLINKDVSPGEIHTPFSRMFLRKWISCIVIAAYHIYHRDLESSSNVLAACFSKLMRQNIIPNAKNVKGPLYCHPLRAVIGKNYTDRCWDIYQTVPKVSSAAISDIMSARHFIWMFKVLGLFGHTLTTTRLLEILSQENPAIYSSTHSNLDLEITFLEFFEALLGCAEVKNTHGVGTAQPRQCDLGYHDETTSRDQMKNSPILIRLASPQEYESTVLSSSTIISSASTSVKSLEEIKSKAPTQSSLSEEIQLKDQGIDLSKPAVTNTSEMELHKQTTSSVLVEYTQVTKPPSLSTGVAEEGQLEDQLKNWINRVHQFFTHTFFPVYEHNLVLKKELQEERQRQTTDNRITLEKAKANAKLREQQRAEEEEISKEKEEEDAEESHVLIDLNNSSAALKQSPTNKKKKRK